MASSKYVQDRPVALPSQLPSLTGMRFIAAAMVFFSHIVPGTAMFASARTTKVFDTLFDLAGFVGVGFFFILSGFVLTWSVRTTDTAPKFRRRRFFKIYPNHLVTFVVVVLSVATAAVASLSALLLVRTYQRQPLGPSRFVSLVRRSRSYARETELISTLSHIENAARRYYLRSRRKKGRAPLSDVLEALLADRIWDEDDLAQFRWALKARNDLVHRGYFAIPSDRLEIMDKQASRLAELVFEAVAGIDR